MRCRCYYRGRRKKANATPNVAYKDMSQDKWKALKVMDSLVRDLIKTEAAEALKKLKNEKVFEGLISAADGEKLGFSRRRLIGHTRASPNMMTPWLAKFGLAKSKQMSPQEFSRFQFL